MLISIETILPTAMGLVGLVTFVKTTVRDRDASRDASAKERLDTQAALKELSLQIGGVDGRCVAFGAAAKQVDALSAHIQSLDDHLDDIRDDLKRLHDTQRMQGERLARLEARVAVHPDAPPESWRRLPGEL